MIGLNSSQLWVLACLATLVACGGAADQETQAAAGSLQPQDGRTGGAEASGEERNSSSPATTAPDGDDRFGFPLEHPERYYGLYASSEAPDRQWFVIEARRPEYAEQAPEVPPGHLSIGAMFGDVAPWHMRTLSATEFEQAWANHQSEPVTVVFELDSEGTAIAMTFANETYTAIGRLERQGDLPEEWR